MNKQVLSAVFAACMASPIAIIPAVAVTTIVVTNFATPPAHAGWIDRVQLTGAYVNVNGNPYYLGDYNQTGGPVFPGVTWELRNNGQIIAKGYGRTPRAALWLIQKFFQPIHAS